MAKSWVETANAADCDFPLANLPYGVASRDGRPFVAVAIGDCALDLSALEARGLLDAGAAVFGAGRLNPFMALGAEAWSRVRARLTDLLAEGRDPALRDDADLRAAALRPLAGLRLHLPFDVAEYTDFYSGRQHAFNVGALFRGPENALPPNWLHIPIAYNGRASTVVVSGAPVVRPNGQLMPKGADAPHFGPSRRLDFELELGAVVGTPSEMGRPVTVAEAERMIFGYVLLNDWSARDIQGWEYQPLGSFQAKAFATTVSPWVVTSEALAPFRVPAPEREVPLLPYLAEPGPGLHDIALEVRLAPEGGAPALISRTNARELYYSAAQQIAHHASSGCAMRTGDLLGSGTISGPGKGEYGSLLELSWAGAEPVDVGGGETRTFLEDGDALILSGHAQGDGYRIGFGECAGRIDPAVEFGR